MVKVFLNAELRTKNAELAVSVTLSVVSSPLTVVFIRAFRLRFQLRRRAFRYIFARFVITSLAKDAAPIPNANATINKNANPDYKVNVFFFV